MTKEMNKYDKNEMIHNTITKHSRPTTADKRGSLIKSSESSEHTFSECGQILT